MNTKTQHVAIIGANKEGLALLPILLTDDTVKLEYIVEPDPNAMLCKLGEMGYSLAGKYGVQVSNDIDILRTAPELDIIIDCIRNGNTQGFLQQPEFNGVKKMSLLSAKLLWGLRSTAFGSKGGAVVTAKEQFKLLSSMREIVDAVKLTSNRKEVLTVILVLAIESTRAERGSIMLLDKDDGTLRVEVARGMDNEVVDKIRVPLGEGIAGKVAMEGRSLLLSGKAEEREFKHIRESSAVKSALCVPLIVDSDVIGVVNVGSSESAHAFTKEDLDFLTNLATLAAEVIHRSQEYSKMKYNEIKFELSRSIDTIINSPIAFNKRLAAVCERLSDIMDGIACFIYIYDEDLRGLALRASSVVDVNSIGHFAVRGGGGIEGWVAGKRERVVLKDISDGGGYKMYLALPMEGRGKLTGVLSMHFISDYEPEFDMEPLFESVASYLAESIDRIKREEDNKQHLNKMFAVDETGLELMSISDPDRFYLSVSATAAAILGAEGSTVRVKHSGTGRYRLRGAYGLDDERIRKSFILIEKEILLDVVKSKVPVIKEIPRTENEYIRSVLSYPVVVENKVLTVLTLFNKSSNDTVFACNFAKSDIEVLKRLAMYIAKRIPLLASKEVAENEYEFLTTKEFLERRALEEINRAMRFGKRFLLLTIRIPNLKMYAAGEEAQFLRKPFSFIKEKIRKFDIVARLDEESLAILFLETDEKALRVIDEIMRYGFPDGILEDINPEGDGEFSYGYAIFPEDGSTFQELLNKSFSGAEIRIGGDDGKG